MMPLIDEYVAELRAKGVSAQSAGFCGMVLRESLDILNIQNAAKKKLKRAERALLAAPVQSPWDTLHKLFALTSAVTVTKEIDRHIRFEVMAALFCLSRLNTNR